MPTQLVFKSQVPPIDSQSQLPAYSFQCSHSDNERQMSEKIDVCFKYPSLPTMAKVDQMNKFIVQISVSEEQFTFWTRHATLAIEIARVSSSDTVEDGQRQETLEIMERLGKLKITQPTKLDYLISWTPDADLYGNQEVKQQEYRIAMSQLTWFGWVSYPVYISDVIYM
ncbi:hypothetical protein MP228_004632 [Amoeboaphelidium protococcarum]|nr:hypothetical protein MP228_004632 [Amoeboaphelidium protococcarum]